MRKSGLDSHIAEGIWDQEWAVNCQAVGAGAQQGEYHPFVSHFLYLQCFWVFALEPLDMAEVKKFLLNTKIRIGVTFYPR